MSMEAGRWTARQTNKQTNKQTSRQAAGATCTIYGRRETETKVFGPKVKAKP